MTITCIIPAAGSGTRMGGNIPKPFLPLDGRPVIFHTLTRLRAAIELSEIVLVLPSAFHDAVLQTYGDDLKKLGVTACVRGGTSRQESVRFGLEALQQTKGVVMVHDAVRPFVSKTMVEALCTEAQEYGAALPVLPMTDTIKNVADKEVGETIPREGLFGVQTPQVFRIELLREAYRSAASLDASITDDAMLVEAMGGRVRAVPGCRYNLKLTTPEDMDMALAFLKANLIPNT